MATFEEKAERLKKELEEATNDDQRRNLSREYELTLRLLRIIRGEVFTCLLYTSPSPRDTR